MTGRGGGGCDRPHSVREIDEAAGRPAGAIKFALEDVLLLLLYADPRPIEGRTRLLKEVFLALCEVIPRGEAERVDFRPHRLGPYAERVYAAADRLAFANKVQIARDKNRGGFSLAITPGGRAHIGARFDSLPAPTRERLAQKRLEWDTLTPAGIRDYVYTHHGARPESAPLKGRLDRGGPGADQGGERNDTR